jgi:hypothetical protein
MKATDSISNTDRLNYLNIGLMLFSCAVAFFVPFELFLFSYAILGPAHYLTEISWLHERNYFTKGKKDFILLGLAGLLLFFVIYIDKIFPDLKAFDPDTQTNLTTALVYIAFLAALAMVVLKDTFHRFIAFLVILVSAFLSESAVIFFSVFLPTLIHVYIFTGLFILYGALKTRSKSGYLSFVIFMLCPLLFVFFTPDIMLLTSYARETYSQFHVVNFYSLNLWDADLFRFPPETQEGYNNLLTSTYNSTPGLIIMRFIAFAYTYHYLNWFSKTTVIKWHKVPKKRLAVIAVLWLASIGFYIYDYRIGFNVLFLLSFLHVFLEFPLNHVTFIGIFQELRNIATGKPMPQPAVKGKKSR